MKRTGGGACLTRLISSTVREATPARQFEREQTRGHDRGFSRW